MKRVHEGGGCFRFVCVCAGRAAATFVRWFFVTRSVFLQDALHVVDVADGTPRKRFFFFHINSAAREEERVMKKHRIVYNIHSKWCNIFAVVVDLTVDPAERENHRFLAIK